MEKIVVILVEKKPAGWLVSDRPHFGPTQVRSLDEVIVGRRYVSHLKGGGKMKLTVVSPPFQDKLGWWVKTAYASGEEVFLTDSCLNDLGVVPYKGGWWNESNWLERV